MSGGIVKQTLSEQIYEVLRADILTQKIPCGQKLTLQSLKERFAVSHTPIREALTRLAEEELATYDANVGVTVAELSQNDVREIFQLMGDFDCLALRYCVENGNLSQLTQALGEIIDQSEACLKNGDCARWTQLSDEFHLALYRFASNSQIGRSHV